MSRKLRGAFIAGQGPPDGLVSEGLLALPSISSSLPFCEPRQRESDAPDSPWQVPVHTGSGLRPLHVGVDRV